MINELFPFQKIAVSDLRNKTAMALNSYRSYKVPQVVSLQAPTGSGKTIIMASLIEDILYGSDQYTEQPEAIFVWLSDSPQLNEQSKQKIEQKADKIRIDQCVVIADESFDQEYLTEGHIYFLNTQKLGRGGNLGTHSDKRQYTIWETIENTTREKYDRLYFIIDEAHRGMQGHAAGVATTIMQRFILGSEEHHLSPVPIVIGMSATAARFTALVGETTSTLQKTIISPAQVRASGLLKDRIILTYPEDPSKHSDMAVLQAATDEWIDKCKHWHQYTVEQHYSNVNPVFVIQVLAGSDNKISNTDLDDALSKVEERIGDRFHENEVVHTFGSVGTITVNGLNVPHVEPSEIADNRKIKVVFFKENLSTGWDCPRAETMMSFRHAEDATYIAQLLGRMIRTPLQSRVLVDDSLNDVRLFLPYFNKDTVRNIIDELQNSEGGEIPTVIEGEAIENHVNVSWTVHTKKKKPEQQVPGQMEFFAEDDPAGQAPSLSYGGEAVLLDTENLHGAETSISGNQHNQAAEKQPQINSQHNDTPLAHTAVKSGDVHSLKQPEKPVKTSSVDAEVAGDQRGSYVEVDREDVIKFINEQGYLTYMVKDVRITTSYLKSLLSLAGLLTHNNIYIKAKDEVEDEITDMIRAYVDDLHAKGKYDELSKKVLELKLSIQIFDVFGETINDYALKDWVMTSESDLDRQLRAADARLGGYGFQYVYGRRFIDFNNPNAFKIDCILFAADDDCIAKLNKYAEKKFHDLNDQYRKYVVTKSEKCRKAYSDIVADGDIVSKHNFSLPETISARVEEGGKTYSDHLFADENGSAVIKLNGWEEGVLEEERKRSDFVCWLRNPSRQAWSMRLPYEKDGVTKATYPDFIIVRKDAVLGYVLDILEPHNPDFNDNLPKAKAFARYAEYEQRIGRIQLIRKGKDAAGNDRFKRLDMAKGAIRAKVLSAVSNDELDHIFDTDGEIQE